MIRGVCCAAILLFFFAPAPYAAVETGVLGEPLGPAESEDAIERLRVMQAGIESMAAHVSQRKTTPLLVEEIRTEGSILLKKPHFLRWEVDAPEKLVVVIDGEVMWQYRPDAKEARKRVLSNDVIARQTMRFFSSAMSLSMEDLSKRFLTAVYKVDGSTVVSLRPRSKMAGRYLKRILIWYGDDDGALEKFLMEGKEESVTVTEFGDVRINTDIDENVFKLVLPGDVRIISLEEDEEIQ